MGRQFVYLQPQATSGGGQVGDSPSKGRGEAPRPSCQQSDITICCLQTRKKNTLPTAEESNCHVEMI